MLRSFWLQHQPPLTAVKMNTSCPLVQQLRCPSPAPTRSAIASGCWKRRPLPSAGGGPDASLEGVAARAGVGIGTLYRHFPAREALFEAVYRREVDQLAELAERLATEASPGEALRRCCTPMCGWSRRRRAW